MKKKRLLLFIVSPAMLGAALVTGFSLLWTLFVLSLLVLLINYILAFVGIRGLDSYIKPLPGRCQVGESFNHEITLFNKGRAPRLLLEARETTDMPGYQNLKAFNLRPEGAYTWATTVNCRKRGEYRLGSLNVIANDPFGLFPQQHELGEQQKVIVCPATLELPLFSPLLHQGSGYGPERWMASFFGPNVASVREYSAGDSLKRIHWLSTAHTHKLMVKIFDPDRTRKVARSVWVVLDTHEPAYPETSGDFMEEQAVTIAASLVKKYVDESMPVGFIASGAQPYLFQPDLGERHMWNILTTLALVKASGIVPVERLIASESSRFSNDSILIVVTPSISEHLAVQLRQLRNRGVVVVATLLDQTSFGGTGSVASIARALTSSAIQVHIIRQGDDLPVVLDSRAASHTGALHDGRSTQGGHIV